MSDLVLFLFLFFETGSHYVFKAGLEFAMRSGWPQSHDPPASGFWVLELQLLTTIPGLELSFCLLNEGYKKYLSAFLTKLLEVSPACPNHHGNI
jgi:hypothetical protein